MGHMLLGAPSTLRCRFPAIPCRLASLSSPLLRVSRRIFPEARSAILLRVCIAAILSVSLALSSVSAVNDATSQRNEIASGRNDTLFRTPSYVFSKHSSAQQPQPPTPPWSYLRLGCGRGRRGCVAAPSSRPTPPQRFPKATVDMYRLHRLHRLQPERIPASSERFVSFLSVSRCILLVFCRLSTESFVERSEIKLQ